ncbi:MAG: thioredoxin [Alphaproteobacteria bacterium]|nr:thioredoxin [Alphaproteobacteria bacterium]MCD8570172.1 thioredoxin [Alphaproteobacteria bacterium]
MFFGSKKSGGPDAPANTNAAVIFDVSAPDFEDKVMRASMEKPVIVDFWAPWCGPCKQMMPTLEKAVNDLGGDVLLAKVNIDENPELAQALRIQSVPTVYAFLGGRPVDAFQGAQPESAIKTFLHKVVQAAKQMKPDALDIPEALKGAAEALAQGDLMTAQNIYVQVLGQDERNVQAYVGLVRVFIAANELEQAAGMVENAPPEIAKSPLFAEAKTALELAQNKPSGAAAQFEAVLAKNPDDHQARLDFAGALFAEGKKEAAIEQLLISIEKNRMWNEEAARKQLLKYFEALGPVDPLVIESRRKLSSLLFS